MLYQSSITSVPLHSHGTTDEDTHTDHTGITSDGDDHIRGQYSHSEHDLEHLDSRHEQENGSPDHEVKDSASDLDSLTDHHHYHLDDHGYGSSDGSYSTFEHSHSSISSVDALTGDSSPDEHFHTINYTVMEDESYLSRYMKEVEVETEVSYMSDDTIIFTDYESYDTMTEYFVEDCVETEESYITIEQESYSVETIESY